MQDARAHYQGNALYLTQDSEGSAENRVKFTKYGQLEELIRLIDEELTKKFDGA